MRFIASTLIWFGLVLPMILISFPVVAIMLLTKWDGGTTWFGNFKYGRGNFHYRAPSDGIYWKQWRFLCIRNPVSNFGKQVISVQEAPWVWMNEIHLGGDFYWAYGWKYLSPDNGNLRTFLYRPWRK